MFDVAIIDLKTSNIKSVVGACKKAKLKFILTSKPSDLRKSKSIILPGVGSFKSSMKYLGKKKLINPIKSFFKSGKPILGICLGMQLFFKKSLEFGSTAGLNIINSKVKKFPNKKNCNLPNIGWSHICTNKKKFTSPLLKNIKTNKSFYFVHSFYIEKFNKKNHNIEYISNGSVNFCTFINFKNLYLVQFHPEKSGIEGLKIYKNFKNLIKKSND